MSSFLCFICHNTVNSATNEETREKYREVIGMNLCPDAHLCYICCHVLNKFTLFRSICLKRSLEYPVLFSEKGILNLQRNDVKLYVQCSDEECQQIRTTSSYHIYYDTNDNRDDCDYTDEIHQYVELEEDADCINPNLTIAQTSTDMYDEFNAIVNNDNEFKNTRQKPDITDNPFTSKEYTDIDECNDNQNYLSLDTLNCDNDQPDNEMNDATDEFIDDPQNLQNNSDSHTSNLRKHKSKKSKKKGFEKIILSLEQQKADLEANRREKKYIESEFKCYNCALGFLFKDTYQAHMMRHEESNGEYRCALCTLRFASHAVLRTHASLHAERYRCTRCRALLRPRDRPKHLAECLRGQTTDRVSCHLCANLFKDSKCLQQHLRRVHSSKTTRVHPCSICGETSRNQSALRAHMLKHLKKKFTCDQCPATYSSPYTLNQHKKRHERSEERHFCTTCAVSFNSRKGLLAHRRNTLTHQQTVFECNKCSRVLPHRRALEAHERKVHSDRMQCMSLSNIQAARIRRKTTVERVVCHLCGNSFKGNSKLNRHLREVCEKAKQQTELVSINYL